MIEQKNKKRDKKNDKVPSENISSRSEEEIFEQEQEGDIEETGLEQKEAKIRKSVQNKRARNLKHQENFIDDDQEMLAKKRKQKQPAKKKRGRTIRLWEKCNQEKYWGKEKNGAGTWYPHIGSRIESL